MAYNILNLGSLFILEKEASVHSYSTILANFDKKVSEQILKLSDLIAKKDLAEDGVEDQVHVTILYGLHEANPVVTKEYLNNVPPFEVTLSQVSAFYADDKKDFDVLKLDVTSSKLHMLNKKFRNLKHTNKYPEYKPHVTIAYLKEGKADKYIKMIRDNDLFKPIKVEIKTISLADKDENLTNFNLREKK